MRGLTGGLIPKSGREKEGRLAEAAPLLHACISASSRVAQHREELHVWATASRFFIETSQTFVALLSPVSRSGFCSGC